MKIMESYILAKIISADSSSESFSESSSDSENSDEDIILINLHLKNISKIKILNYVEHVIPQYTDLDFKSHFRLSRSSVENLILDLKMGDLSVPGRPCVSMEKSLLLTIWTISNQECFRSVADRFGLDRGNAHKIFIKTCTHLTNNITKYIKWPEGNDALNNVEQFNQLRGPNSFPGVFGCVDGTHIPIPGPKNDNSYYNRKGFHSILLQGICNAKQEFINVYCGWPGSTHDARMWQNSTIYKKLEEHKNSILPSNTYLLGDSAYPLRNFIMVPFKDNGHLTIKQKMFNKKLSSTRVVIEQAFGRLKGLFRRLKYLNVINLKYSKYVILSACILHNVSIKDGYEYTVAEDEEENDHSDDSNITEKNDSSAKTLRDEIMNKIC